MSAFTRGGGLPRIVAFLWLCLASVWAWGQSGTPTYLYTSAYTVDAGTPVTFSVGVNSATATGTVTFMDGSTPLGTRTLVAGEASLDVTFSAGGSHVISAIYSGNASNAPGNSGTLTVRVLHGASTTTLASSVNPSGIGQLFTLTATVTGSDPMGYVSIYDGGIFLTTINLSNGVATLEWGFWNASTHSFTAVFADDYYNASSTSNTVVQRVVAQSASTTQLTSSVNPSGVGQGTVLTAAVTGASPTGTVTFKDGATTLGTATLSGGAATLTRSFSTTGAHSLTAAYGGDSANAASSSAALSQTVNALATSTTTLASTVNPSTAGQSTTLRASVSGFNPSGSVTFRDGATVLGTAPLTAGVASYAAAFSTTGTHAVTASYGGDAANATSTSTALQQTVNALATTSTTLATTVNPAAVAQTTTLTATVTGADPTGNVTFKDGATTLGTAPLASGRASLATSFATAGAHALTAAYAGDVANAASASTAITQTVNAQTVSSTALTSSINPSGVGQATVLRATVTGSVPSGSVTFNDGATVLGAAPLAGGVATWSTGFATTGTHALTAAYGGDPSNTASTSPVVSQTVNALASTSTVLSSSVNPAFAGQNMVLTAAVAGSNPGGSVTFKDGATSLGSVSLVAGVATLTRSFAVAGTHVLTAVYAGDAGNGGSTSAPLSEVVKAKTATTTALATSVNPSFANQVTVMSATVTGSSPTGTVTFKDGTTTLGTANLSAGVATLSKSFAATGAHSLTAAYAGDVGDGPSTSAAVSQTVNPQVSTSTVLASSVNPAFVGQTTTLTATVAGSSPTGTVTFKDGTTALGTAPVINGAASLASSFASAGTHSLSAAYSGDAGNVASTSSTVSQTVKALAATTTTVASSVNPVAAGQTFTLTATVAGVSPTGTVTFRNGASPIGTFALSSGIATMSVSMVAAGSYSLSATYSGDVGNSPSTSAALVEVVNPVGTTSVALSSSVNPSTPAQPVTLTARVTGSNPTGNVTFKDGATVLGTVALAAGTATFSQTFTAGSHGLSAFYAGDPSNGASTSAVLTQVSSKIATTTSVASGTNPSQLGQSVTVTATVLGSAPTGSVSFMLDGAAVGSRTLVSGQATYSFYFGSRGTHALSASYLGDAVNATSTAPTVTQTIGAGSTATTLSASPNPAMDTDTITLSWRVTGAAPLTGSVALKDGTTVLSTVAASDGLGSVTTTLPAGVHSLTAQYLGDPDNLGSTSAALAETVNSIATSTVLASSMNPSAVGQAVTLSAAVTGGVNPNGMSILFQDGGANLGTAVISGRTATLQTTFTTPGVHSVTATMTGNSQNLPSVSPAVLQSVGPTRTTLAASVNPAVLGQNIAFTATVTGASPTGTVSFRDGGSLLGSAAVQAGVATFQTSLAARGDHQITASYGGDAGNAPSSAGIVEQVWSTDVALSTSANPAAPGQPVTLGAMVIGTSPTGTVTFKDGTTVLGTGTLSNGSASLSTTFASVGVHMLTAAYSGDAGNAAATSDALGQQVAVAGGGSAGPMTWSYLYDAAGNTTTVIDPNGNRTQKGYDLLRRLVSITEPIPAAGVPAPVTTFSYDALDRLAQVKDPRNLATSYTVNGLGDTSALASPDAGNSSATFDASGNALTRTDARGKTTTLTYDALGRVTRAAYATGAATSYEYDGGASPAPTSLGRLTRITDESGTTTYTYDSLGHVLSKIQVTAGKTLTVAYGWGTAGASNGKLTSVAYPSGARVNYSHDAAGRVQAVSVNPPNANGVGTNTGLTLAILSGITYNADNRISGWTWANNAPYLRTYDGYGRLASFPVGYAQGTGAAAGLTRTLVYDNAGRITGFSHANASGPQAGFNQSFGYDGIDRLVQQLTSTTNFGFGYDATGNRVLASVGANSYVHTVSPSSNRLTVVQTPGTGGAAVNNNQSYTASGSLVADGNAVYTYSDRGRMASSRVGLQTTAYLYNGLEQRVKKSGPLVSTGAAYFAYDEEGRTIGEYDANLVPVAETVFIGTVPVAVLKQSGSAAASTLQIVVGNVYADQIDTPRVVTRNSDEAILWRWDATEAFGNTLPLENPNGLGIYKYNQRMPGQIFDAEDQSFYNWNRDYQLRTGRYIQSDPIGLVGGFSTYAYVGGNPISYIDPDGLAPGDPYRFPNQIGGPTGGGGGFSSVGPRGATSGGPYNGYAKPPVVIGETMTRVELKAAEVNGMCYQPTKPYTEARNARWASDMRRDIMQGKRELIDLGIDPLRAVRSPAYELELRIFYPE